MIKHTYQERAIDSITPYEKNSRTHSTKQIAQIMASIKEYGFTNPLLIDERGVLIAGHGRLEAVKQLNKVEWAENPIEMLPCIVVEHLTSEQRRALVIADNKIALNAGWDYDLLKEELSDLDSIGFDMDLLGFDRQEIDDILNDIERGDSSFDSGDDDAFDWAGDGEKDSEKKISAAGLKLEIFMNEDSYRAVVEVLDSIDKDREQAIVRMAEAWQASH